jgi:hypothetical protein
MTLELLVGYLAWSWRNQTSILGGVVATKWCRWAALQLVKYLLVTTTAVLLPVDFTADSVGKSREISCRDGHWARKFLKWSSSTNVNVARKQVQAL